VAQSLNPFATQNSLAEPDTWSDLFVPGKLTVRKRALWNCLAAFAYPYMVAVPLAVHIYRKSGAHPAYTIGTLVLIVLAASITYMGVRFLRFARDTRASIRGATDEQTDLTLSALRDAVRTFCRSMMTVGLGLMIVRLFLS